MSNFTTTDPDFAIGRGRIFVSLIALLSIFIDPTNGGFLGIEPSALVILLIHLGYGILMYIALAKDLRPSRLGDHLGSARRVICDRCGVRH